MNREQKKLSIRVHKRKSNDSQKIISNDVTVPGTEEKCGKNKRRDGRKKMEVRAIG